VADRGASIDRAGAPRPDDPRKPKSPPDLHRTSWRYALRKTLHEFTADQCTDLAAALTYYLVLSLFPGMLALVSLLGIFGHAREATDALLRLVEQLAPRSAIDLLRETIEQVTSSPAAGVALAVGIVGALWSASGYVGAFGRAMNRVYEIDEGRPAWKLRPMQLLVTVAAVALMVVIATVLVVSGPISKAIGSVFGLADTTLFLWSVLKWPVLAAAVIVIIAVLYYATPNVRQPRFRWMSVGSFLAVVILGAASLGFGFYVANFANYDRTYGSLGGVIVFLLWLWIANLALLFGAEFDSEMERARELQAGMHAEERLRLPPRDVRVSAKAADREAADILQGRQLRRGSERAGTDADAHDATET